MSEPKRYWSSQADYDMDEAVDGGYVRYEDYDELHEQVKGLKDAAVSASRARAIHEASLLRRAEHAEGQIADMERVNNDVRHAMKQAEQRVAALRKALHIYLSDDVIDELLKLKAAVVEDRHE